MNEEKKRYLLAAVAETRPRLEVLGMTEAVKQFDALILSEDFEGLELRFILTFRDVRATLEEYMQKMDDALKQWEEMRLAEQNVMTQTQGKA